MHTMVEETPTYLQLRCLAQRVVQLFHLRGNIGKMMSMYNKMATGHDVVCFLVLRIHCVLDAPL